MDIENINSLDSIGSSEKIKNYYNIIENSYIDELLSHNDTNNILKLSVQTEINLFDKNKKIKNKKKIIKDCKKKKNKYLNLKVIDKKTKKNINYLDDLINNINNTQNIDSDEYIEVYSNYS